MGVIAPREVTLPDQKKVTLRSARLEDADAYLAFLHASILLGDGHVKEPTEFSKTTAEVKNKIVAVDNHPSDLLILAWSGERIIADLDVKSSRLRRAAHTSEFGISIVPEFRGLRLGELLIRTLIEWVESSLELEKINLRVLANNPRAIALYRRLGFREDGRKVGELKYSDGTYVDDIAMSLWVKDKKC